MLWSDAKAGGQEALRHRQLSNSVLLIRNSQQERTKALGWGAASQAGYFANRHSKMPSQNAADTLRKLQACRARRSHVCRIK
jgi:hypothetical protein